MGPEKLTDRISGMNRVSTILYFLEHLRFLLEKTYEGKNDGVLIPKLICLGLFLYKQVFSC